jgi:hypothetical protein
MTRRAYAPRPTRTPAQLARAQALMAPYLRPPPRALGPDPCNGALPRRLKGRGKGGANG